MVEYDKSEGRALRLLEIYFYIEEHPGVTAENLAQSFGISPATLYRDIQSLKKMGIHIDYESPNRGGYRIEKGSIRFVRIKPAEVKPLLMAKSLLEKLAFPGGEIFNRLIEQIVGTIRDGEIERIQEKLDTYLYLRTPMNRRFSLECDVHVQYLSDLLSAAENQWSVRLAYARSADLSSRTINPLGLWFGHNAWYLAAWDQDRNAYRTFAVDRIEELELLTNKPFTRPSDFNLADWVETSWIARPTDLKTDVESVQLAFLYETGVEISQSFWHPSQEFELPDNPEHPVLATFQLSKNSLETELLGWIHSFGPHKVTVLSPAWLRDQVWPDKTTSLDAAGEP